MRMKVKIGEKRPHPMYMPINLAENEGFVGNTDLYANAKTLTIVHPKAKLCEIRDSLGIVLRDIELRINSSSRR